MRALVLTAIQVETDCIERHLVERRKYTGDSGTVYTAGRFLAKSKDDNKERSWDVFVYECGPTNPSSAADTERAIQDLDPDIAFFSGIAGGFSSKGVLCGDIIVPSEVGYYEYGKDLPTGFRLRKKFGYPTKRIIDSAVYEGRNERWLDRLGAFKPNTKIQFFNEPIVSGEKVLEDSSSDLYNLISQEYPTAFGVEMEAHGFFLSCDFNSIPSLMIRGLSDLLDDKNTDGEDSKKQRQKIAAEHAISFTFEVLNNLVIPNTKPAKKSTTVRLTFDADITKANMFIAEIYLMAGKNNISIQSVEQSSVLVTLHTDPDNAFLLDCAHKLGFLSPMFHSSVFKIVSSDGLDPKPEALEAGRLFNLAYQQQASQAEILAYFEQALHVSTNVPRTLPIICSFFDAISRGQARSIDKLIDVALISESTDGLIYDLEQTKFDFQIVNPISRKPVMASSNHTLVWKNFSSGAAIGLRLNPFDAARLVAEEFHYGTFVESCMIVNDEKRLAIEGLVTSPNFAITHSRIAEMARFELTDLDIVRLLWAASSNTQVRWIAKDSDVKHFYDKILPRVETWPRSRLIDEALEIFHGTSE